MVFDLGEVTMAPIKVFISHKEGELDEETNVAGEVCHELKLQPFIAEHQCPDSRIEFWIDELKKSDIFLIIVGKEPSNNVKKELEVALEIAIPVLALVRTMRSGETRNEEAQQIIERLKEVGAYKKYDTGINHDLSGFKEALRNSLAKTIAGKWHAAPRVKTDPKQIYAESKRIIEEAEDELYVVQRSCSLLVGARNVFYEIDFFKSLATWIEGCRGNANRQATLLYVVEPTVKEITSNKPEDRSRRFYDVVKQQDYELELTQKVFADQLKYYTDLQNATLRRFQVSSLFEHADTMVVNDREFAFWVRADKEFLFIADKAPLARNLIADFINGRIDREKLYKDMLREVQQKCTI